MHFPLPHGWHTASQLAFYRLPALVERFTVQHNAMPFVGCELEWYFMPIERQEVMGTVVSHVAARAAALGLQTGDIQKESGLGQYEVAFTPQANPQALVEQVRAFQRLLMEESRVQGIAALFSAKPFPNQYGSAIQVHIHLEDASGKRLYVKKDSEISDALAHSMGGLLAMMDETMLVCAPAQGSYARFVPKQNAPLTRSWGGNNRTTALRLPLKTGKECHIEYRVAGADADIASLVACLLAGVLHGLEGKAEPGEQIHGDASDKQYALPRLPQGLEKAVHAFEQDSSLESLIGGDWKSAVLSIYR